MPSLNLLPSGVVHPRGHAAFARRTLCAAAVHCLSSNGAAREPRPRAAEDPMTPQTDLPLLSIDADEIVTVNAATGAEIVTRYADLRTP